MWIIYEDCHTCYTLGSFRKVLAITNEQTRVSGQVKIGIERTD